MYQTTLKDFARFKKLIEEYQDLFELNNWDIMVEHIDIKDSNLEGRTYSDVRNHCAQIQLNKKCCIKADLEVLAVHEIMHVFFAGMKYLAECRYLDESEICQTHEEEVTKITNILMKKFKRR